MGEKAETELEKKLLAQLRELVVAMGGLPIIWDTTTSGYRILQESRNMVYDIETGAYWRKEKKS